MVCYLMHKNSISREESEEEVNVLTCNKKKLQLEINKLN